VSASCPSNAPAPRSTYPPREFILNGTDHATHREQASMIRRYIAWLNRNTVDPRLRRIVT